MELVSYVAGEPWSDHPDCACPVISAFLLAWDDGLPSDADRDRLLKPLIVKLIGTRSSTAVEETRAYLAIDWFVRVQTPAWLELAGLVDHALAIREISEIVDLDSLNAAEGSLSAADSAARSAAYSAAYSALQPTVEALQASALDLVARMIAVEAAS